MEPLNLMVTLNLVADDVRHEVTGRGKVAGRSDGAPKKPRGWSALWRKLVTGKARHELHPRRATVLR